MTKNFESFQEFYNSKFKFSVVCFSKTWTDDDDLNKHSNFHSQGSDFVHQIKKNHEGTGTAIFVKSSLCYKQRNDLSINIEAVESLSIVLLNSITKNFINVVYRPPNGDFKTCETYL